MPRRGSLLSSILSIILLIAAYLSASQQVPSVAQGPSDLRHRAGDEHREGEVVRPRGRIYMSVTPAAVPGSLKELVSTADVIVDGRVESVLPSRLNNPADPTTVETDAIVGVREVLKGPETLKSLVVTQAGGKDRDVEIVPVQYELLQQGDRHILFLTSDGRDIVPRYPAVNGTFTITGRWSGNFKVEGGALKTSRNAPADLKKRETEGADVFIDRIRAEVRASRTR